MLNPCGTLSMPIGAAGNDNNLCMLSHFSCIRLFVTLWTVAHKTPMCMGFFRQEDWSGLPCPPPRDLPDPGTEPTYLTSPALAGEFSTTSTTCEAPDRY